MTAQKQTPPVHPLPPIPPNCPLFGCESGGVTTWDGPWCFQKDRYDVFYFDEDKMTGADRAVIASYAEIGWLREAERLERLPQLEECPNPWPDIPDLPNNFTRGYYAACARQNQQSWRTWSQEREKA